MKTSTRYKVIVGDSEVYRDDEPTADELDRMAYLADQRGYTLSVHRCKTTIDMSAPTGHKIKLDDVRIFPV